MDHTWNHTGAPGNWLPASGGKNAEKWRKIVKTNQKSQENFVPTTSVILLVSGVIVFFFPGMDIEEIRYRIRIRQMR